MPAGSSFDCSVRWRFLFDLGWQVLTGLVGSSERRALGRKLTAGCGQTRSNDLRPNDVKCLGSFAMTREVSRGGPSSDSSHASEREAGCARYEAQILMSYSGTWPVFVSGRLSYPRTRAWTESASKSLDRLPSSLSRWTETVILAGLIQK